MSATPPEAAEEFQWIIAHDADLLKYRSHDDNSPGIMGLSIIPVSNESRGGTGGGYLSLVLDVLLTVSEVLLVMGATKMTAL